MLWALICVSQARSLGRSAQCRRSRLFQCVRPCHHFRAGMHFRAGISKAQWMLRRGTISDRRWIFDRQLICARRVRSASSPHLSVTGLGLDPQGKKCKVVNRPSVVCRTVVCFPIVQVCTQGCAFSHYQGCVFYVYTSTDLHVLCFICSKLTHDRCHVCSLCYLDR